MGYISSPNVFFGNMAVDKLTVSSFLSAFSSGLCSLFLPSLKSFKDRQCDDLHICLITLLVLHVKKINIVDTVCVQLLFKEPSGETVSLTVSQNLYLTFTHCKMEIIL